MKQGLKKGDLVQVGDRVGKIASETDRIPTLSEIRVAFPLPGLDPDSIAIGSSTLASYQSVPSNSLEPVQIS